MRFTNFFLVSGLVTFITAFEDGNATPGNWSVRLMADLRPDNEDVSVTVEKWNIAVDTMITKSEAYIISELIEDMSIINELPEAEIRKNIDRERAALELPALPPYATRPSPRDLLERYRRLAEEGVDEEDFRDYLPKGWTEEMYRTHDAEDVKALTEDQKEKVRKRAEQRTIAAMANLNTMLLEMIPGPILTSITEQLHEVARKNSNLPSGVRVYKREIAPLAQVVEISGYEKFGFVLYRTWYENQDTWEVFMKSIENVNTVQLNGTLRGEGIEVIKSKYMMALAEEEKLLDGVESKTLIKYFAALQKSAPLPKGLETGIVLMADQSSIESVAVPGKSDITYIWAVDITYDPEVNEYPDGYAGLFRVHPSALLHDLYVVLASGAMSPVDIWGLLKENQRRPGTDVADDEEEEEEDDDEDDDESWMHEEL